MPAGSISEPQPGAGAPRVAVCALAVFATLAVARLGFADGAGGHPKVPSRSRREGREVEG
jgi:hypothetical protein